MAFLIRRLMVAAALVLAGGARAAEEADFGVAARGGGFCCTGDLVAVDVVADFNLTGTNDRLTQGYSLAVCHVPYQLEIESAVAGQGFADLGIQPTFHQINAIQRGVVQAVVVDFSGARGIPPVNAFRTLRIAYRAVDAADGAPVWPCDRTLSSPPLVISFSTGDRSYSPPPENLRGTVFASVCDPAERAFHVQGSVAKPIKVRCGTHAGSSILDIVVREDPVACCPPRLLRGVTVALAVPEDLRILRVKQGDFPLAGVAVKEGQGCSTVSCSYLTGGRFGSEGKVAFKLEIASRPEFWPDGFAAANRTLAFTGACPAGDAPGAVHIDGRILPFAAGEAPQVVVRVEPHCPTFKRGDANVDGQLNIGDPISLLSWLYGGGTKIVPPCLDAADANDDGTINIGDPITLLRRLYEPAGPLPEPADACGKDPTSDPIDCEDFPPCAA